MKSKQLVLVLAEPTQGMDDEFHRYYEDVHLDEVIKTAGFSSAQRFGLVDQTGRECPLPHLALYEVEVEAGESAIETINRTRAERIQSDSLNRRTAGVWVFEPLGPRHEG